MHIGKQQWSKSARRFAGSGKPSRGGEENVFEGVPEYLGGPERNNAHGNSSAGRDHSHSGISAAGGGRYIPPHSRAGEAERISSRARLEQEPSATSAEENSSSALETGAIGRSPMKADLWPAALWSKDQSSAGQLAAGGRSRRKGNRLTVRHGHTIIHGCSTEQAQALCASMAASIQDKKKPPGSSEDAEVNGHFPKRVELLIPTTEVLTTSLPKWSCRQSVRWTRWANRLCAKGS